MCLMGVQLNMYCVESGRGQPPQEQTLAARGAVAGSALRPQGAQCALFEWFDARDG